MVPTTPPAWYMLTQVAADSEMKKMMQHCNNNYNSNIKPLNHIKHAFFSYTLWKIQQIELRIRDSYYRFLCPTPKIFHRTKFCL